jgi:hypothetical protein
VCVQSFHSSMPPQMTPENPKSRNHRLNALSEAVRGCP